MCISSVTSIHQSTIFLTTYLLIYCYSLDWNHPTFSKSWEALECISQHHESNHNTKFCSKKKINWWIHVTIKIMSLFRRCSLHTCLLLSKNFPNFHIRFWKLIQRVVTVRNYVRGGEGDEGVLAASEFGGSERRTERGTDSMFITMPPPESKF